MRRMKKKTLGRMRTAVRAQRVDPTERSEKSTTHRYFFSGLSDVGTNCCVVFCVGCHLFVVMFNRDSRCCAHNYKRPSLNLHIHVPCFLLSQCPACFLIALLLYSVEDDVDRCTHLICGKDTRTIKVLMTIARGGWVLSPSWLFSSLEARRWLDEENFESAAFPGAAISRKLHLSKGVLLVLLSLPCSSDFQAVFAFFSVLACRQSTFNRFARVR